MSNKSALCVSTYSRDQMEPFASEQTSHVFNVFKVSFQIFPRLVMKPNVQNPLQFGRFQRCTLSEYSCSTTKISKLLAKRFGQKLSLISPVIFIACLTVSYSQRLPHFCAKFCRKKKTMELHTIQYTHWPTAFFIQKGTAGSAVDCPILLTEKVCNFLCTTHILSSRHMIALHVIYASFITAVEKQIHSWSQNQ